MAAVWVAGYHLLLPPGLMSGLAARLLSRGYLAVDLFFVLSGYVMALTYGGLFAAGWRGRDFAGFLVRRFARLYPLYGTILITRFGYTLARYGSFDLPRPWIAAPLPHPWTDIPANLLLIQSWGVAPSSIGPAWSISTEWAAYFAFPLLATIMLHRGPRMAVAGAAGGVGLLVATALLLHRPGHPVTLDAWNGLTPSPMMRCLAGFSIGLGTWRVAADAERLFGHPAMPAAVLACLVALVAARAPDLAIYPLLACLVLCLGVGRARAVRLFAWPPVVWLGEISFSLYLLHIFLLHPQDQLRATLRLLLPPAVADVLTVCSILVFLLAASDVCYRVIERPGRRLVARLVRV